jgi:hypothetical protein
MRLLSMHCSPSQTLCVCVCVCVCVWCELVSRKLAFYHVSLVSFLAALARCSCEYSALLLTTSTPPYEYANEFVEMCISSSSCLALCTPNRRIHASRRRLPTIRWRRRRISSNVQSRWLPFCTCSPWTASSTYATQCSTAACPSPCPTSTSCREENIRLCGQDSVRAPLKSCLLPRPSDFLFPRCKHHLQEKTSGTTFCSKKTTFDKLIPLANDSFHLASDVQFHPFHSRNVSHAHYSCPKKTKSS